MPAIVRLGDLCTGHGCWPSRPNSSASPNVYIGGLPAHRKGDSWTPHCCGPSCHGGVTSSGSSTIMVNNKPVARVGDPVSCGSTILTGYNGIIIDEG